MSVCPSRECRGSKHLCRFFSSLRMSRWWRICIKTTHQLISGLKYSISTCAKPGYTASLLLVVYRWWLALGAVAPPAAVKWTPFASEKKEPAHEPNATHANRTETVEPNGSIPSEDGFNDGCFLAGWISSAAAGSTSSDVLFCKGADVQLPLEVLGGWSPGRCWRMEWRAMLTASSTDLLPL